MKAIDPKIFLLGLDTMLAIAETVVAKDKSDHNLSFFAGFKTGIDSVKHFYLTGKLPTMENKGE